MFIYNVIGLLNNVTITPNKLEKVDIEGNENVHLQRNRAFE